VHSRRLRATRRFFNVSAALAIAAPLIAAVPAAAAAPAPPKPARSAPPGVYAATKADDAPIELTVVLTPSSRSALRALATTRTKGTPQQRAAAVAKTQPTATARAATREALVGAGLQVVRETPWQIKVTAPVSLAARVFGVTLVGSGNSRHPASKVAVPAFLGSKVTAVLGFDQRPLMKRHVIPGTLSGPTQLRGAYDVTPSPGASGTGTTVATVQFSGWFSSDLAHYATNVGLTAPTPTQVPVDGADPTIPDGTGGEDEVAIDQEMVLAGAPQAAQRIYFAPNTAAGSIDAYNAIADDVTTASITAVSTSWGICQSFTDQGYENAIRDAISRAVAAGATTFAATGDSGAQDCGSTNPVDVDLPAVLPEVVGVGGTRLTLPGGPATESGWSGSGGGQSYYIPRPAYQSGIAIPAIKIPGTSPAQFNTGRLVPDISATADDTSPNATYGYLGGDAAVGGTSAAAPLMASMLAATLSVGTCPCGIGDIHDAIYANPADFNDVTTGYNGYATGAGYDMVTGLGTPNWSALCAHLVSGGCPLAITTRALGPNGAPLKVGAAYSKQLTAAGGTPPYPSWALTSGALPAGLTLSPAGLLSGMPTSVGTYSFTIQVADSASPTPATASRAFTLTVDPLGLFNPLPTQRAFAQSVGTTAVKVQFAGVAGVPVTGATAVVVNVEVYKPSVAGYLRVTPFSQDAQVATQEFATGQTISNLVVVKLVGGAAQVKLSAGVGQVFMDVAGYYRASSGSAFTPLPTTRVFAHAVGTTATRVQFAGVGGVAAGATAVVVNVEVYKPSTAGYVRVTPFGQDAGVATQEFATGQTISNLVVVKLAGGAAQVKLSAGVGQVFMDVAGYYTSGSSGSSFTPIATTRVFAQSVGTGATPAYLADLSAGNPVPPWATAVVLNVEVFNPSAAGYLRVTPYNQDAAVASQEFVRGQTISNLVVVKLVGGAAQVKLSAGSGTILMDVAGYYS